MSTLGATTLLLGFLGQIDSSRTVIIHLTCEMKWSNHPLWSHLHYPWAKLKDILILSLDIEVVRSI